MLVISKHHLGRLARVAVQSLLISGLFAAFSFNINNQLITSYFPYFFSLRTKDRYFFHIDIASNFLSLSVYEDLNQLIENAIC